jgi:transposase-like protein
MAKKKRHSPEERKNWASRWHASGLSGGEFARRHGLPTESVYRWGKEFAVAPKASNRAGAFTEVRVGGGAKSEACIEVVLGNGRALRIPAGVDAARVRALIEVLESC